MGFELSPAISAMLWWLLPAGAPVVAWWIISRRSKADPNSDITGGVNELRRFQRSLAQTQKPTERKSEPSAKSEDPDSPDASDRS